MENIFSKLGWFLRRPQWGPGSEERRGHRLNAQPISARGRPQLIDSVESHIYTFHIRIFDEVVGFEWDDGNRDKNLVKHGVSSSECEEVFLDSYKVVRKDSKHSRVERRHIVIGKTNQGRILFISFTVRQDRVRVISARMVNKKERKYYGQ